MSSVLEIQHVSKQFTSSLAVNDVSMAVEQGTIFGLLGPNGAGKTTLIRMINQITLPDSGKILLHGRNITERDVQNIGYMPEERGLYRQMAVFEQLVYLARLKGLPRVQAQKVVNEWMEKFEINDWKKKKVEELSKGMQQKVQFIATVLHKPDLIILDEPLSGLDPLNAQMINESILELQKNGSTIIFSTHRMEQVEEICDSIVLMDKGHNILQGKVADIKQKNKLNDFKIGFDMSRTWKLNDFPFTIIRQNSHDLVVHLEADQSPSELLAFLVSHTLPIVSFVEILPSLTEIFIQEVS